MVMLVMSHDLRGADGVALRQAGYTLTFTTGTKPTPKQFEQIADFSNRDSGGAQTRIYGGVACDLDRDGWSDLTLVNEVSADLRVFMNRADGSGLFGSMLPAIPYESSPNEVADFNGDGFVDMVISSNATNQVSLVFGNGDGTFDPAVLLSTPQYPRGFGVMDADGDGDMDFAVANTFGNNISLFLNNGTGGFGSPVNFNSGGSNPYGMAAADMNNDGILDLVVGHTGSQTATVLRGNGDGTFTFVDSEPLGGACWVLVCGDVNGDRNMDLSTANSFSQNGTVIKGNGDGTLQSNTVVTPANTGHMVATDLADIDGDGDMDLILSSFGAGRWYLYENNGSGTFTFLQDFIAQSNPACCLPADFDNDGDVDLCLIDEIADTVRIIENVDFCDSIDFNNDGVTPDTADIADFVSVFGGGPCSTNNCNDIDFNNDGVEPDTDDLTLLLAVFGGSGC
jgi:hypothetical protein